MNKSVLRVTQNKGFQMRFDNGNTISVQFGTGNYCSRKDMNAAYGSEMNQETTESDDAEIAIWKDGIGDHTNWFRFSYDTVLGHCTPDQVAMWISLVSSTNNFATLARKALTMKLIDEDMYVDIDIH